MTDDPDYCQCCGRKIDPSSTDGLWWCVRCQWPPSTTWPEVVAPPERDILAGQIVMDAAGNVYRRRKLSDYDYANRPWYVAGMLFHEDEVIRPLTFFVPEPPVKP